MADIKVNGDTYILIDQIIKQLQVAQEEMKAQIKDGATIEFKNKYGTIKINDKTRKDYTKEEKADIEAYAKSKGYEKQVTTTFKEVKATATDTATNKATKFTNNLIQDIINNGAKNISIAASAIFNHTK